MSKHIHRESPLLPIFVYRHYQNYLQQLTIMEPMNNQQCRNRVAEIITVLALSPCRKLPKIKIPKDELELSNEFSRNLVAPNTNYIKSVWRDDDFTDLRIPLNELFYQLNKQDHSTGTQTKCLFWLYWIFDWETKQKKLCKKSSKRCPTISCSRRVNKYTDTEWARDYIWIIWDICFMALKTSTASNKKIICHTLFKMFCNNYKTSKRKSKQKFIIHAVLIILDTHPQLQFTKSVFIQYPIVIQSTLNINELYKKIGAAAKKYSNEKKVQIPVRKSFISQQPPPNENTQPHPFYDFYMKNELYLNPEYNDKSITEKKDTSILGHLDKFYPW